MPRRISRRLSSFKVILIPFVVSGRTVTRKPRLLQQDEARAGGAAKGEGEKKRPSHKGRA
jgi:hypothetical protein